VVSSTQPTDAQFSGSAAGGQTRAVVDAEGRLVELTVDALLLRRPPRGVAEAILSAVQQAQDAAARSVAADASAGPADDAADTFDPARRRQDDRRCFGGRTWRPIRARPRNGPDRHDACQ
jgi:hypothetical protein